MAQAHSEQDSEDSENGDRPLLYVSYASADAKQVGVIVQALAGAGELDLFVQSPEALNLDSHVRGRVRGLPIGADWMAAMDTEIRRATAVLVCLSEAAIGSKLVLREAALAQESDKYLPCRLGALDLSRLPMDLGRHFVLDLSDLDGDRFGRAINDLVREVLRRHSEIHATPPEASAEMSPSSAPEAPAAAPPDPLPSRGLWAYLTRERERADARAARATVQAAQASAKAAEAFRRLRAAAPGEFLGWAGQGAAALLSGLLVAVIAVYGLSELLFTDLLVRARDPTTAALAEEIKADLRLTAGGDGVARVYDGRRRMLAAVSGHGAALVAAAFEPPGVVTVDTTGLVRRSVWSPFATRAEETGTSIWSAAYRRAWTPFGAPLGLRAANLRAEFTPVTLPDAVAGRPRRVFRDCVDCPQLVELTPGWFFTGGHYDPLRGATQRPAQLTQSPAPLAVMATPVTVQDLVPCVLDGACPSAPVSYNWQRLGPIYAAWLSRRTGRVYRMPTRAELTYAVTGGKAWRALDQTTLSGGSWQSLAEQRYAFYDCAPATERRANLDCAAFPTRANLILVADGGPLAAPPAPPPPPGLMFEGLAPRLYIQVSEDAQKAPAQTLGARLSAETVGGAQPIVPRGIDLKPVSRSFLRCFTPSECRTGRLLLDAINAELLTPVSLDDASATFGNAGLRVNHYELWFAPGPIQLRPAAPAKD